VSKPPSAAATVGYVVCVKSVRPNTDVAPIKEEEVESSTVTEEMLLSPRVVNADSGQGLRDQLNMITFHTGTVVRVNALKKLLFVRAVSSNTDFASASKQNSSAFGESLCVSFDSEDVFWMEEPKPFGLKSIIARPSHINEVIGCTVAVPACGRTVFSSQQDHDTERDPNLDSEYGDYFVAVVASVNVEAADADTRYLSLISFAECLILMDVCVFCYISSSPCPFYVAVACYACHRPPSSALPPYRTALRCTYSGASSMLTLRYSNKKRNVFKGSLLAAPDSPQKTKIVMSQTLSQSIDQLLSSEADDSALNTLSIPAYQPVTVAYDSPDIAWLTAPEPPSALSLVAAPETIYEAVGYGVQVRSNLPGTEDGDYFSGTVSYTDQKTSSMFVCFESSTDHNNVDIERFAFGSEDVCWMQPPPTTATCVGCKVGIRHLADVATSRYDYPEMGFIVGTVTSTKQIMCVLQSGAAEDGTKGKMFVRTFAMDKRILPFDWLSVYPQPLTLVPASRPSIQDVVGYVVELEHDKSVTIDDNEAEIDEPLTALVTGVSNGGAGAADALNNSSATGNSGRLSLRVRFFAGHEFDDEEDIIPFANSLKFYMFASHK
jgi:hypothetical protein